MGKLSKRAIAEKLLIRDWHCFYDGKTDTELWQKMEMETAVPFEEAAKMEGLINENKPA